jgi:MFS family permease
LPAAGTCSAYRDLRGFTLMVDVAGHAFIDVRTSLNSFVPAQLTDSTAAARREVRERLPAGDQNVCVPQTAVDPSTESERILLLLAPVTCSDAGVPVSLAPEPVRGSQQVVGSTYQIRCRQIRNRCVIPLRPLSVEPRLEAQREWPRTRRSDFLEPPFLSPLWPGTVGRSLHSRCTHATNWAPGLSTLGFDPTSFQTEPPACYRASWQLPGPDSHRQATTSLRLQKRATHSPPGPLGARMIEARVVTMSHAPRGLGRDFYRLWCAYSISELGSALGAAALPLIAILVLHATNPQVSLLAALPGVASAAIALPLGAQIEFRRKRPIMISADLLRFAVLASLPVAAAINALTYPQLCVIGTVQTVCTIVFNAASGAHLKALVPVHHHTEANSRFETTFWTTTSIGPPAGGLLLISWLGPTITVAIDAVSFLASALGIRNLRTPEAPPPAPTSSRHWFADLTGGWRYIFGHRGLNALFWNAMLFGGSIMLTGPLIAILMLRDLELAPWQYGLALGLPGLGGILGSLVTKHLVHRATQRTVLLTFGVLRTLWMGLIPLAPAGTPGLTLIIIAETLLLFSAGVFNPTFVTYRMNATTDEYMSRVGTAWSISSRSIQPAFIAAGGVLAVATSTRTAIGVAALVLLLSTLLLPWRSRDIDTGGPANGQNPRTRDRVHSAAHR